MLAEIRGGRLTIWEAESWRRQRSLPVPPALARSATLSPDLRHVAGGALWQIGADATTPLGGANAAFSPDSRRLAVAVPDGTIQLWDVRSGRPHGHALTAGRDALSVTWDGALLVSGGRRGLDDALEPHEAAPDESGAAGRLRAHRCAGRGATGRC